MRVHESMSPQFVEYIRPQTAHACSCVEGKPWKLAMNIEILKIVLSQGCVNSPYNTDTVCIVIIMMQNVIG